MDVKHEVRRDFKAPYWGRVEHRIVPKQTQFGKTPWVPRVLKGLEVFGICLGKHDRAKPGIKLQGLFFHFIVLCTEKLD